jgi:hypothetical protein
LPCKSTLRCPADIANFVVTAPAGVWALLTHWDILSSCAICRRCCWSGLRWSSVFAADRSAGICVQKIPNKYKRVISTRSKHSSPRWVPLNAVECCRMSAKLQQCLPWLSDIEDAHNVRVLSEGGEEMRIVRRSREAQKRRSVRHCLLSLRWGHATCWRAL